MPHLTLPLSFPALIATAFLVSLATVAVPGPITLVASRLALAHHLDNAVFFLVGVTAVDVALFTALAAGAAPTLRGIGALPLVEIVGGLALFWGGYASLRQRPKSRRSAAGSAAAEPRSAVGSLALGLFTALGNPHYWIWWVTAGLAFVEAAKTHRPGGLPWMLAALVGGVVTWYVPLLWACRRGRTLLGPRGERVVMTAMGVVLLVLGAGLTAFGFHRLHWA